MTVASSTTSASLPATPDLTAALPALQDAVAALSAVLRTFAATQGSATAPAASADANAAAAALGGGASAPAATSCGCAVQGAAAIAPSPSIGSVPVAPGYTATSIQGAAGAPTAGAPTAGREHENRSATKPQPKARARPDGASEQRSTAARTDRPDAPASPAASGKAGAAIQEAKTWLGTPYKWGGTSRSGVDCSGFVQQVLSKVGVQLPRVASDQAHAGSAVSKDDLQPGDLVFFATDSSSPGKVSHVGLYLGDGLMMHAPRTGKDVETVSVNSTYYKEHYVSARRVL